MRFDRLVEALFGGSLGGVSVFVIGPDGAVYQAGNPERAPEQAPSQLSVIDLYDAGGGRFTRLREFDEGQLVRLLREDPAVQWSQQARLVDTGMGFAALPVPGHFSADFGSARAELHYGCRTAASSRPVLQVSDAGNSNDTRVYSGSPVQQLYRQVQQAAGQAYR